MTDPVNAALRAASNALRAFAEDESAVAAVAQAGRLLAEAFRDGHRVYACGNGGSMCDAMHFAEELTGRYRKNRDPLPALAISDPSHLTCVGNDFGFDEVFSRFVTAHGREGDVLIGISTSGTSANVLAAVEAARASGMHVIALTGRRGSPLGASADVEICSGVEGYADRNQEVHILVLHTLVELVERELFPANYA